EPDPGNGLPGVEPFEPLPELFDERVPSLSTDRKVGLALDLEARTISLDGRVTKVDTVRVGDAVSRVAIASTAGLAAEYARTDAWCVSVALAVEGDETQTGFAFRLGRSVDDLEREEVAAEAVDRAVRILGAVKPPTARVPVVLDRFAA